MDSPASDFVPRFDSVLPARSNELIVLPNQKTDGLDLRFTGRFDALHREIHAVRVWGLGLYITLAGMMLTVIGRGFGWI